MLEHKRNQEVLETILFFLLSSFLPSLPAFHHPSLLPSLPSIFLPSLSPFLGLLSLSLPSFHPFSLLQSLPLFARFLGLASVAVYPVLIAPIPAIGPAGKTTWIGNWTTMFLDVTIWLELLVNIITILSKFRNASCNTIRTVSAPDIQRVLLTENLWISYQIITAISIITQVIIEILALSLAENHGRHIPL